MMLMPTLKSQLGVMKSIGKDLLFLKYMLDAVLHLKKDVLNSWILPLSPTLSVLDTHEKHAELTAIILQKTPLGCPFVAC